ncbi:hypothetical protein [Sporomusa acidovorans]|uniref:Uncharacterized protein n=1 Tax=Sporomusa acidovorans (strain ATCC 49682 / DSM 3132 / Mol) TaxID=1123286 RepID=A0ABZ3J020_SPOA4|nr:hypothetical protein [Sporomusa acidovorans]OZC22281.1 hypothetical protein SPACI_14890 [Sporomusa acidovorans DSM 3132]SDF35419.1 hypothetical protein SAMN04488499_104518 [Sporomusa acidovorans]
MQHYECKKVENCFGGTYVYEYRLGIKNSEEFLEGFKPLAAIKYYKNFPRPFFQAVFTDGTTVKGVIADSVIKVSFPENDALESKQSFETVLEAMLVQWLANRGEIADL